MGTLYEQVQAIVGSVPSGYEPFVYLISGIVLLVFLQSVLNIFASIVRWCTGNV